MRSEQGKFPAYNSFTDHLITKINSMKKFTISLIAFVFIFCSCGQLIQSQTINREEIDDFIEEKMEIYHVPGLSACIIIGDSIAGITIMDT